MHVPFAASLSPQLSLSALPQFAGAISLVPLITVAMLGLLVAVLVLGIVLRGSSLFQRRHREMHALAERLGLHPWPNNSLPRGLSLHGTPFFRPTKLTNIYEGLLNHVEVIIFDFQKLEPDSIWARTIIAVKSRNEVAAPPALECRRAGSWQLLFAPVGALDTKVLMDTDGMEIIIKAIIR